MAEPKDEWAVNYNVRGFVTLCERIKKLMEHRWKLPDKMAMTGSRLPPLPKEPADGNA
jgi:hypothetical protein